jgi:integrase
VSEVTLLRFDQWSQPSPSQAFLQIYGQTSSQVRERSVRTVPVSVELYEAVQDLKKISTDSSWIFLGFNKFGSLGSPISSRGVELLVKFYGPLLGFKGLTPRIFRHSIILQWFEESVPQKEIQARLGLKTTYAFRSYEPLIKSLI